MGMANPKYVDIEVTSLFGLFVLCVAIADKQNQMIQPK